MCLLLLPTCIWFLIPAPESTLRHPTISLNLVTENISISIISIQVKDSISVITHLLRLFNYINTIILTCLCPESDYTLQKTRPYHHESDRRGPIPGAGGLTLPCALSSCHHHTSTWTCFLTSHFSSRTDLFCQSHGQSSALLWFGGRLQWIFPAVFARPGDATASFPNWGLKFPLFCLC